MTTLAICRNGFIPLIALVFFFIMANVAFAETKVFIEEYAYQASEYDSKVSCRALALEQVKRLLLEKLGTYLESETEVKNFQLTKDQIVILTAGIVSAEIIDEKWDGKTYYLKAKIAADPKDVIKSIDLLRHDRRKTKDLEETRKKADEALREVERLKKELETAKAGKTEQDEYKKAVNILSAMDWFEKGRALEKDDKQQEAIEAYSRAIELNPQLKRAYIFRAHLYRRFADESSTSTERLRNCQQAIKDYDKAIKLDPKDQLVYRRRGDAYADIGDHRQAIKDYDRAIELGLLALVKGASGIDYSDLGEDDQRIFAEMDNIMQPTWLLGYYNSRGNAYRIIGDYQQAIKDYDKAIELDPKDAVAYYRRATAYMDLGDRRQAMKDYKTAARLGDMEAQGFLGSRGISW